VVSITKKKKLGEDTIDEIKEVQFKWLNIQLDLASEFHLPILLHQRGGFSDCIGILEKHIAKHKNTVIIVNCFNGSIEELKTCLALCDNVYFIITGLICSDDRGSQLREVVKSIPIDRLLLASDAPHLNPYNMPRPYPKRNEPGFLGHVLVLMAEILDIHFEKLAIQTTMNARKVYGLPTLLYDGVTTKGDIIISEIQKEEDARFKKGSTSTKSTVPKPNTLDLQEDQHVFILTKEDDTKVAFVVNTKEKSIMEKQQAQKSVTDLLDLAQTIELKPVEPNTNVMKGLEVVYSNVILK